MNNFNKPNLLKISLSIWKIRIYIRRSTQNKISIINLSSHEVKINKMKIYKFKNKIAPKTNSMSHKFDGVNFFTILLTHI